MPPHRQVVKPVIKIGDTGWRHPLLVAFREKQTSAGCLFAPLHRPHIQTNNVEREVLRQCPIFSGLDRVYEMGPGQGVAKTQQLEIVNLLHFLLAAIFGVLDYLVLHAIDVVWV